MKLTIYSYNKNKFLYDKIYFYIWKKMALVKQKLDQIKTNGRNNR
jgi:hypothetical protein